MAVKFTSGEAPAAKGDPTDGRPHQQLARVLFTKEISPAALVRIYEMLGRPLRGKVAVKMSTGEPGGNNWLHPELIADLVKKVNGTIVENNTAYPGRRNTVEAHWETIREHGFPAIAPCDLLDEEGDMAIPVGEPHFQLAENYVGSHLARYDSILMLSHFKGHQMAGLGGALKNMSIGVASAHGKLRIHTVAKGKTFADSFTTPQDAWLEAMADADKSVMDYMGRENIVYISVANRLSVDCDCNSNPAEPEMADIGIFASTDPVAVDQACVDAVYNSPDPGKKALIERMESKHGEHTIWAAEKLGLGLRSYQLVDIG